MGPGSVHSLQVVAGGTAETPDPALGDAALDRLAAAETLAHRAGGGAGGVGARAAESGLVAHLEAKRYGRHGAWIPRKLEFDRHAGDVVLALGDGLGTDCAGTPRPGRG